MIFMLAGTSDARALAIEIRNEGHELLTTVVTDNAANEMNKSNIPVHIGRLTADEMIHLIESKGATTVIDASHPFAEEASKNAIQAAKQLGLAYIRYERASQTFDYDKLTVVPTYKEAAQLAATKKGVIMLTTGSKTLQVFTEELQGKSDIRLVARMLPRLDNMEKCEQLGFPQKNIIAIQGPFTKEFDEALYKQYKVNVMITKESGKVGSVDEKVDAAKELGIEIIMIARPNMEYGMSYSEFSPILKALKGVESNGF
ncbi:precorrin-6A reductase [Robertmurraya sp. P23]|uniref:precorrin-6A reductase n=1 Tax=Robertmurraya sp. P23 TaxID=3436931 RepID=UPI003D997ADF